MNHNKETGDNVGPLILSAAKSGVVDDSAKNEASSANNEEKTSIISKIKGMFRDKDKDGLTTKEKLAKMGLSALLSYGWGELCSILVPA